ncbi:MAG TPA: hypothetical protein VFJ74_16065 [Gemmatimonadaceae bacterium]|nr:hypothetical protein [Gemmatimonadaceae bacterium]
MLAALVVGGAVVVVPRVAVAQDTTVTRPAPVAPARNPDDDSFFSRLGLDRLRLSGVGFALGGVKPSQMEATKAFTLEADYGEIVPHWRVVFVTDVWSSRLDSDAIRRYRDALRRVTVDPAGDDEFNIGTVRVSDIALGVDTRWSPQRSRSQFLHWYLGGGLAAHVLNGEGRAIANTFVERSLDNIAVGPSVAAGLDAVFFQHVTLGMQARYDLVSGARYGSLRAVGTYIFDRAPEPPKTNEAPGKRRHR